MILHEVNRQELIRKSKTSDKGLQRFERRKRSHVGNTVKSFNQINMNKLFHDDILTVDVPVSGETSDYTVKISFSGLLELLREEVTKSGRCTVREISRAAIKGFNKDDVYLHCSCPDFQYRFNYYATRNDFNSGAPETRPSDITNPEDTLGSACKHVLLVLNNTSWMLRVARVINNYIKYMEKHQQKMYADAMYPKIFDKDYEDPVQLSFDDTDDLETDTDTIDAANEYGRTRTQFQKGNQQGIRFAAKDESPDENQDDLL